MNLLSFESVQKWVGEGANRTDILRGISFSLDVHDYLAIMGPSGSGKSTLLNLLGLLDRPSGGTVRWRGQDVTQFTDDALAMLRAQSIGFIFQLFNLVPYLTARQNVALPYTYATSGSPLADPDQLLTRMRLAHRLNAYPPTLSGGEKQRVAIARALANGPALILADEPTGALDTRTGDEIMDLLAEAHSMGTTVVLITHNEAIARRAQRVLVIRDGVLETAA